MKSIRSIAIAMLLATGSMVVVSSDASAFVCIAKNANKVPFTAIGPSKLRVTQRALAKCEIASLPANKGTCYISSCSP